MAATSFRAKPAKRKGRSISQRSGNTNNMTNAIGQHNISRMNHNAQAINNLISIFGFTTKVMVQDANILPKN
jgi:hypothetical protein